MDDETVNKFAHRLAANAVETTLLYRMDVWAKAYPNSIANIVQALSVILEDLEKHALPPDQLPENEA
jgi:hypothetical protein